tara:strand:- start:140 stop:1060 length:921 start_codon:yes stop_codon:yes gene_type:complete
MSILAFLLSDKTQSAVYVIPKLGTLALGAQRLLPCFQQSYSSWANIKGSKSAIVNVINMIEQPISREYLQTTNNDFVFERDIVLSKINFSYIGSEKLILNDINLSIKKGEKIGLIGTTGSGKSTLTDLIMGLLRPSSGKIKVDGLDINDTDFPSRITSWRKSVSHVPQNIYLIDSTFAENIAFGFPKEEINMARVEEVASLANIYDFITSTPKGFNTFVGEAGIKMSGGQRQRIGIARALYRRSKLLILDEATSALDNETERKVMKSILNLNADKTILIIAHRLSTVSSCDRIIEVSNNSILEKII